MQNTLFENEKVLKLQEVESGFDVLNSGDFDKDVPIKLAHSPSKATNEKIGQTKEEFEAYAKKCYGVRKVEWVVGCKFGDCDGHFYLNSVKVNYKLKGEYIGVPHLEFTTENKEPCLLTETGYRSDFMNLDVTNSFNSIQELIKYEVEHQINYDDTGNKKKGKKVVTYDLKFDIPDKLIENDGSLNSATKGISQLSGIILTAPKGCELTETPEIVNKEKDTSQEQTISPEEASKQKTIEMLDKMANETRDVCWAIRNYFESFLFHHKNKEKNPYYLQQIAKYNIDVSDLNKLVALFREKEKLHKIYYEKAHFMRWGTNGEEYANV